MQDARGHHLVGIARLVQQAGHLDGVRYEGQVADVTGLAGVAIVGESERVPRQRRALDEVRTCHCRDGFKGFASQNVALHLRPPVEAAVSSTPDPTRMRSAWSAGAAAPCPPSGSPPTASRKTPRARAPRRTLRRPP